MQFQRKEEVQTIWSNGREKMFTGDFDHWKNPEIIKALKEGKGKASRIAQSIAEDLENNKDNPFLLKFGKVSSGAAGHTVDGAKFIAMKQEGQYKALTKDSMAKVIKSVENSVNKSAAGKPLRVTMEDLYNKVVGRTYKTETGWIVTYVHEMGHQIHFKAGKPSLKTLVGRKLDGLSGEKLLIERKKLNWVPSEYGTTNELEQFAETFTQYVFAPEALKKASPLAYEWVEAAIKEALK